MKKVVHMIVFIMVCCIGVFLSKTETVDAKIKMTKKTLKLTDEAIDKLSINVRNCNLEIFESEDDDIHVVYNKKVAKTTIKQKDYDITITIKAISEECQVIEDFTKEVNIFQLYLPKKLKANLVKVKSRHSGIYMKVLPQANLEFSSQKGCIGIIEPKKFRYNISCSFYKDMVTMYLQEADKEDIHIETDTSTDDKAPNFVKSDQRVNIVVKDVSTFNVNKEFSKSEGRTYYVVFGKEEE